MAGASFSEFFKLLRKSRRESSLLLASALSLLMLTSFSFWLTQRVSQEIETTHKFTDFNTGLMRFIKMLRTVESSQRGYLLTGDPSFLTPYDKNVDLLVPLIQKLGASVPPGLGDTDFSAITISLEAKLDEMARTVGLQNEGKHDEAVERVKTSYGRGLMLEIEQQIQKLRDKSNANTRDNEVAMLDVQNHKFIVDLVGSLLVITFSCLSLLLLLRSNAALFVAKEALAQANADLEQTVAQRTRALKRANDEIQRFAYIVSHDLRSPLVNIMGFTAELETLRTELFERLAAANALAGSEALNKDFDEAFGFIKSSIARMDRLIAAILKISREGKRPLNSERIDVTALVQTLVSGVAHQVREKDASVTVGALPPVMTDRLALEQIFSNLIENAVKFLNKSGKGEIRIEGQQCGSEIVYAVSDNGRGVDRKDYQRIFELFRRSGPQDVPGEGMGLAYVAALTRRLGGTITVESALGQGSTFKLTLPAQASVQGRYAV